MRGWLPALMAGMALVLLACGGIADRLRGPGAESELALEQARAELADTRETLRATQAKMDEVKLALAEAELRLAACEHPELAAAPPSSTTSTTRAAAPGRTAGEAGAEQPSTGAEDVSSPRTAEEAAEQPSRGRSREAAAPRTGQLEIAAPSEARLLLDGTSLPYSRLKDAFIAKDVAVGAHVLEVRASEGAARSYQTVEVEGGRRARYRLDAKTGRLEALGAVDASN